MNILHLEDNRRDAELIQHLLRTEWPDARVTTVTNREDYLSALDVSEPDLILSDFKLPGFSGRDALSSARERRPETPFIFVSGTIGEDAAVESVHAGAADYLLKDRLQRLPIAIRRALTDSEQRRRRRHDEQQLREQAELLEKVQDGIVVTDLEHHVLYWNRGAERIFGWPAKEVLGRDLVDLFGPALKSTLRTMDRQLTEADEWRGELSLGNKERRTLLAEVRVTTIRDAAGAAKSRLKIVTDITERKRLEEQLLRAQRLESLGMLAAGIAHDLNNALAPMLMAGGLLRTRVSDPADVRLVELLEQSAERGAALVKQIVAFAGGRSRERMLLQTKHVVRDLYQLLQDTFPKSIRLEHELPNTLWPVRGDPTQLHQVLLNLCINARDAMPHGGVLKIVAQNEVVTEQTARNYPGATSGRFVVLQVKDTGTGIPPEAMVQIWQPFFTTKPEGKGTGLGLSTVRGIVANHGGFLTVESEEGQGATFSVFLPAAEDETQIAQGGGAAKRSVRRGRGEVVFVVDDQVSVRESIGVVLAQHGYRPLTIPDGIEALSRFADRVRDVALVITDLDMPGLNGAALAQAILHLNPTVKILFISGTGENLVAKGAAADATGFLAKPFTPDALLGKVDELLHGVEPTPGS